MELEIKYGVFLKDKDNPEEWRIFAGWFSKYEAAYAVYNDLKSMFQGIPKEGIAYEKIFLYPRSEIYSRIDNS